MALPSSMLLVLAQTLPPWLLLLLLVTSKNLGAVRVGRHRASAGTKCWRERGFCGRRRRRRRRRRRWPPTRGGRRERKRRSRQLLRSANIWLAPSRSLPSFLGSHREGAREQGKKEARVRTCNGTNANTGATLVRVPTSVPTDRKGPKHSVRRPDH